jgi:endonuclease G
MKKLHFTTWLFSALLLLTACEADDNDKLPTGDPGGKEKAGSGALVVTNNASEDQTNKNKNVTGNSSLDDRYEIPHIVGGTDNYILIRSTSVYGINYVIEWNNTKKAQRWTAYQMYEGNSGTAWNRNNWQSTEWGGDPFQIDPDLPSYVRTELSDYRGSGYTRGHIIASQDRVNSKEANEQTFYLSNMHPQKYAYNGAPGVWGEMENFLRGNWNKRNFRDVLYVVKGGTIKDGQIKEYVKNLLVPQYFFMATVCKIGNTYKGVAFWSNHDEPTKTVKSCLITIDELESKTGIDFFCNLPDDIETAIESEKVDYEFWKLN